MGALPALDIDLLRSFVLIAEGGSFTRAAERVGRTQSAVSLQVKRLESLVGHRLFERDKGVGASLTSEGRRLLARARELTALNDEIVGSLRSSLGGGGSGAAGDDEKAASRPSIAVLPFQNLSGEAAQEYFADGIVDDLITGLSRIQWLLVIARNSSFVYKGRAVDIRQVGRELGVRYVLEGDVLKAGSRLRIHAQLLDAATGVHLWADKYDGALEDVFDLQDRIADQVVAIVEPRLQRCEIERTRARRVESLDAFSLYLRALPHLAAHMPGGTEAAMPLLRQALKLEPDYPAAHALMAWCHEWRFTRAGFDEADRSAALSHARASIAGDHDDATAFAVAGFVIALLSQEPGAGLGAIDRALSLNPSSATALYLGAHANGALGDRWRRATALASRALRLSPFDRNAFEAHMALGDAALQEERYEDAVCCFARATQTNGKYSTGYFFHAMALALAGRSDDAGPSIARGLELEPTFRARMVFEIGMEPALAQRLAAGGRRLGLRE
jgi:adenylate cyclase